MNEPALSQLLQSLLARSELLPHLIARPETANLMRAVLEWRPALADALVKVGALTEEEARGQGLVALLKTWAQLERKEAPRGPSQRRDLL